jgi:acyl-CoA thioesterase I
MAVKTVLFVLTCVVLAGCTKSEPETAREVNSSPVPPPSRQAKPPADTRPVIVALGDSLAEGWGVETGLSFPDQLQRKLDAAGYSFHVVNLGVSGDTTTGGLGRIDYAVSLKPAVIILELGGNDGLRGIPVASTRQNLDKMIVAAKSAGSDVLLAGMTLPPNYGESYIHNFENAYKDLAKKHAIPLIPFLMEDIRKQLSSTRGLMQRDGIHPTAKGHAIIADTVFSYLEPMLKKT